MNTISEVIQHVRKENPTLSHWALTSICMQIWGKIYGNAKIDQAESSLKVVHVEQDGDPISYTDMFCLQHVLDDRGKCTYIVPDYLSIRNLKDKI